jgi:hypothetical protein
MEPKNTKKPEKKKAQDTAKKWIDKAEAAIDDASDKIYNSETYQKAGRSVEKTTLDIFRKAGKWWGKTQSSSKKSGEKGKSG